MIIKTCAFLSKEDLHGNPREGNCNLFPKNQTLSYKFISCETIPISKCPYKLFARGLITKAELNEKVNSAIGESEE